MGSRWSSWADCPPTRRSVSRLASSARRRSQGAVGLEVAKALASTGESKQCLDAAKGVIDVTGTAIVEGTGNTLELHFTTDGKPELKTAPPQKK